MNRIKTTKTIASIGKNIETKNIVIAVPVSTVETIGFPKPPVEAVDAKRVAPASSKNCTCSTSSSNYCQCLSYYWTKIYNCRNHDYCTSKSSKGIEIVSNKLST